MGGTEKIPIKDTCLYPGLVFTKPAVHRGCNVETFVLNNDIWTEIVRQSKVLKNE
jgi:hypothetical protein